MNQLNKIKKVSLFFRALFQIAIVALPIIFAFAWVKAPDDLVLFGGLININVIPREYANSILHALSLTEKMSAFALCMLPLLIDMFILYSLIKLFSLYKKGEVFSLQNVNYIRHIGYGLLAGEIIRPIYEGLMGVILTMNNPHGHRFAAVTFDQNNISMLLVALIVILISWVMAEGCKIREEQQLTI